MTETGTVIKCKNDYAMVRIGRNSACASCGKCGMTENQKHVDFYVKNTLDAQVGDRVELDIPEANSARLALVAYFLPLVPALVLMFLTFWLNWPEWSALLMFVAGLALGFFVVVLLDRARKHKWAQTPTMTAVLPKAPPAPQNSVTKKD